MALVNNVRSLVKRHLLSNIRSSGRLFLSTETASEEVEGTETEKAPIDPTKDRTKVIPVETSMRYLQSKAYKATYGDQAVWVKYRRNHKGQFAPRRTRLTCIKGGMISTGSPCPICRDEYLVLDSRNVALLKQFICQHTGQVFGAYETGLCQKKQKQLMVVIEQAWDHGNITYDVPFREYDYSLYQSK